MNWEIFRRILRPLFLIVGLAFLVALIVFNWNQAQTLFKQTNWLFFTLSIGFAVLDNVLFSILFYWLLGKYSLRAPYVVVGEMFFLGQLAKYIPGRFWSIVYQATYFDHPKASTSILFANLELTAVAIWRGLIIGGGLILWIFQPWGNILLLLFGALGFIWLIQVQWIPSFIKKIRRKTETSREDASPQQIKTASIVWTYLVTIILYISANYMLLVYGFQFGWADATLFIAFFSIAWVAGVIAFVMPAGIGVREAVFVFLATQLNSGYSIETLTAIAIIYRFWQLFHELSVILIGFVLKRLTK